MAQSTVTQDGVLLIDPGTVVSTRVQPGQGNIAAAGVITLVGEADEGPGWQDEPQLEDVAFSPDQYGDVLQKYGSGDLVEAFRRVIGAANDPAIQGSVNLVRMVKTNRSQAASGTVSRPGFGTFATLTALRRGAPGNLIKRRSEVGTAESAPDTGSFSYAPALTGTTALTLRANGGALKSVSITAKLAPESLPALIEDIAKGIMAAGGEREDPLAGLTGIALTATAPTSTTLIVQLASGSVFATTPEAGDVMVIPLNGDYGATADSAIVGASDENAASYVITSVVNTTTLARITATRISSGSTTAASGSVSADENDIITYKPVRIQNVTGMARGSTVGLSGQFTIPSNDGTNATVQLPSSTTWTAQPQVGDILKLASAFGGLTAGFYQVSSASSNTVSMFRLSNGSSGNTALPANIVTPITSSTEPFTVQKPVIDGLGKSLEILGSLESIFRNSSTTAAAGLSNTLRVSAAEYQNVFTVTRGTLAETFSVGGEIAIRVGSDEELSTVVVSATKIDFMVDTDVIFSAPFSQYKTLQDVADLVNSQTGWTATIPSSRLTLVNPNRLDRGTYDAVSTAGFEPARIKRDATEWRDAVSASTMVSPALTGQSGLPETSIPDSFLSGGTKAGSTSADVVAAIDAAEQVDTNFVLTLFSRDATDNINDGLTESTSTYTIDAINAYLKSHVLKMSAIKMKKNRLGIGSKRAPYTEIKDAAGDLSSFRMGLAFQDVRDVDATGATRQFHPWMAAVVAAGMQAAAGYRGIVKKFANIGGVISPFGDFNPRSPGAREDALKAGLLILEPVPTGGFRWVSDQTTYSFDNNFVYNSLQAVYVSDLITLTLIDRFDRAVVGQSVADITAGGALGILAGEMFNFKRLKFIAASDDAPEGYKNAKARLRGGVLEIFCEIKLAGLIYFVPIYLTISQVQQEASQ
jgi:hypothetical protein